LSGRRINDGMASYVSQEALKRWALVGTKKFGAPKVGVLGIAFKENCSDIRNSKVPDMVKEFRNFGCEVFICDPNVETFDAKEEYGIHLIDFGDFPKCDILILAVPHREFTVEPISHLLEKMLPEGLFVDVKSAFDKRNVVSRGFSYWSL
jgi:UDP-N-acetyl-D-galactosamine dehydrogenase